MASKALALVVHMLPRGLFVAAVVASWLDKPLHVVYFTLLGGLGFLMEISENTARIPTPTEKDNT